MPDLSQFLGPEADRRGHAGRARGSEHRPLPPQHPGAREGGAEEEAAGRAGRGADPPRHGPQRDGLRRVRRPGRRRRAAARQRDELPPGCADAGELVKVGDVVDVKILKIDTRDRQAEPEPQAGPRRRPVGRRRRRSTARAQTVTGRVTKVESVRRVHRSGRGRRRAAAGQRDELPADQAPFGRGEGRGHAEAGRPVHRPRRPPAQLQPQAGRPRPVVDRARARTRPTRSWKAWSRGRWISARSSNWSPGLEGLIHVSELSDQRHPLGRRRGKAGAGSESADPGDRQGRAADFAVAEARRGLRDRQRGSRHARAVDGEKEERPELRGGLDF